jgi:3-methyladenine DNA glycosylase AlkD
MSARGARGQKLRAMLDVEEVVLELRHLGEPRRVAALRRSGVRSPALGVALPTLRSMAQRVGPNHRLVLELWQEPVREPRLLASLIDEPERVTEARLDRWAKSFDSWEICDQCCQNLFWRTPFARAKALAWTRRREEFVKRAGLVLVAVLAVHGEQAEDDTFVGLLPTLMMIIPPPRPCRTRKPISAPIDQETPAKSEPSVKSTSEDGLEPSTPPYH